MRHNEVLAAALLVASCGVATVGTNSELPDQNASDLVVLQGNTHPLARAEFDVGRADSALPMERMILSLQVSPQKRADLEQLLAAQQDPASPRFHQWLTPEEFGARFAPAQEQIAQVSSWLSAQGFSVDEVGRSGMWINFTGSVSQVEQAFHTEIHDYQVNGKLHHANVSDPSIPRSLSGVLAGVVSLHNFPRKAMNTGLRPLPNLRPDYTGSSGNSISPGDFDVIYNVNPLYSAGIDGTGQTIAVVARTHPSTANWTTFRSTMGLPSNIPQVVVNGSDPGDLGADEDGEADLDAEWSGASAKGATGKFVTSKSTSSTDGVDLSAQYIVNNNLAAVMTTSFGQCESTMGSSENAFFNNLWSQAASQGITAFVSSGDNGAAGCDDPNGGSASSGLAVSGLAAAIGTPATPPGTSRSRATSPRSSGTRAARRPAHRVTPAPACGPGVAASPRSTASRRGRWPRGSRRTASATSPTSLSTPPGTTATWSRRRARCTRSAAPPPPRRRSPA